jgi:hypothetical protein
LSPKFDLCVFSDIEFIRRFACGQLGLKMTVADFYTGNLDVDSKTIALPRRCAACLSSRMNFKATLSQTFSGAIRNLNDALTFDDQLSSTVELAAPNQPFFDLRVFQAKLDAKLKARAAKKWIRILLQCKFAGDPADKWPKLGVCLSAYFILRFD